MFYSPEYFYFFISIPLLIALFIYARIMRSRALKIFGDADLMQRLTQNFSPVRRILKNGLAVLIAVFFILSLARPQWGSKMQTLNRKGIDLVVLLRNQEKM